MNIKRKDIEIMAPVGCMESLHAAIEAGADAIYFGVGVLNMRAKSSVNFTLDNLAEIVSIARAAGVKSYLTVNTVLYDNEMQAMCEVIDRAAAEGVDAIIAADVAAIMYARRVGMEVHISTQCNISNAVRDFLSICRQKYAIYPTTNGIINETTAIVLSVNSLEQLLAKVNDDCKS